MATKTSYLKQLQQYFPLILLILFLYINNDNDNIIFFFVKNLKSRYGSPCFSPFLLRDLMKEKT